MPDTLRTKGNAMKEAEITQTEILILGAGPVGLMLANLLGLYGRQVIVLETLDELIDYPRAVGLDDEAFRLIQTVGLADQIAPLTGPSHIMRLVDERGNTILYNDPQIHPFGWSRKNGFNQPLVDSELAKGLERFPGVQLLFSHTVEDVLEDADGVTAIAEVRLPDGSTEQRRYRAQYLVGCEGGKSPTRKRMGVSFDGLSPSTRWLVVDVANDPLGTPNVWLGADPKRAYVSIGLPQGIRRWEFRLHDDETDEMVTTQEWVNEALRDHVPDPTKLDFIRWRVYTHHGRVAGSFRKGRQLIAGDAAHLMPVWLGQGWNSGVRDAMNLGWKLASVVSGQASDKLLDTYTEERIEHVTMMVKLSMQMGSVIKLTNPAQVLVRDLAGKVINRVPALRDYFGEMRFRPLPRYDKGVLVDQTTLAAGFADQKITATSIPFKTAPNKISPVGTQFPQPVVNVKDRPGILFDQATGSWWSLVLWMNNPYGLLDEHALDAARKLGARLVTIVPEVQRPWCEQNFPADVVVVGDAEGKLKKWFDDKPTGAVLLRPDHFIAGACLAQQVPQMLDAALRAMSHTGSHGETPVVDVTSGAEYATVK